MRSLQRILFERKTRRFVDEMIHKYAEIRLSSASTTLSRKRQRSEVNKCASNQELEEDGRQTECSTSSLCRTESERSSRVSSSMLDSGKECVRQQQDDEYCRVSDGRAASEYGSAFSSTRLTRLLEEEGDDNQDEAFASRRDSDSNSEPSSVQETEENQRHHSSFPVCGTTLTYFEFTPASTQTLQGNQLDAASLSATPSAILPTLRPTPLLERVIPNCCDFFTSPHPHYAKELIGKGESNSHSVSTLTNSTRSDTTSEGGADSANSDSSTGNNTGEEFEMWDYVCPQYARRVYANEWV